ncbi:MAG: hypothetical protein KKA84_13575 [Bacteroidetes bacterium]|nr:hypothetical protein [Bacteroidota bacterium]
MIYMIDKEFSVSIYGSCILCAHFDKDSWLKSPPETVVRKCPAFEVIPLDIWEGQVQHMSILPDQKGEYVFTELPRKS